MELADLIAQIPGFDAAPPAEKIRVFAWFLHTHRNKSVFSTGEIRECYSSIHIPAPNIAMYLTGMTGNNPPKAQRIGDSYKLTRDARSDLDTKYGQHESFVAVSNLLNDLPGKIADLAERSFLTEAIKCYRVGAFRSCVVMTWNLAYSHLLDWIVGDTGRLAQFNAAILTRYPKKSVTIKNYDDFNEELKESEVVEICGHGSILNANVIRILREKLGKRNSAAHPSTITIVQSQADDVVTDLVNNVLVSLT